MLIMWIKLIILILNVNIDNIQYFYLNLDEDQEHHDTRDDVIPQIKSLALSAGSFTPHM